MNYSEYFFEAKTSMIMDKSYVLERQKNQWVNTLFILKPKTSMIMENTFYLEAKKSMGQYTIYFQAKNNNYGQIK